MYMHAKRVQICTIQLFQGPKNTIITNFIGTLFYGVEGRVYIVKTATVKLFFLQTDLLFDVNFSLAQKQLCGLSRL